MEIKSTTGRPGLCGTRKDYVIRTKCGEKFYAKAVGSQGYECGGVNFDSLKAIKAAIVAGDFDEDATEASEVSTADGADTWDCVHPCALLITNLQVIGGTTLFNPVLTIETLGNYGWLDVMGRPDIARAEREIKRVENLKKRSE
jgi:hypothetical protein